MKLNSIDWSRISHKEKSVFRDSLGHEVIFINGEFHKWNYKTKSIDMSALLDIDDWEYEGSLI